MALVEVFKEPWVVCSCGEAARLINGEGMKLTGHKFLSDQQHQTEIVYDLAVTLLNAPMWAAAAVASAVHGQSADLMQWQNSAGQVLARVRAP